MKKTTCLFCLLLWCAAGPVLAQNESDQSPLLDTSNRVSLRRDSVFFINFRFRMQNRAGYWSRLNDRNQPGFEARVRRLRLRLDGYLYTPKLAYYLQLSFSRADQDLIEGVISQIVRDAIVYYFFTPNLYLGFGQSKLPGNRQRVISSGNLQMPDRSIANELFTLDRDFGVFFYAKYPHYSIRTAISSGEGCNAVFSDRGLAYTGRIELLPMGPFENLGDYSEGDLEFHPTPKLSLAATYSYNHRATRTGGQIGPLLPTPADLTTRQADLMFKYNGWALLSEFFSRRVASSDVVENELLTDLLFVPSGEALHCQASRMIGQKNEVALRYAEVWPEHPDFQPRRRTRAVGFTHYVSQHRTKAQLYAGLDDRWHPETQPALRAPFRDRLQILFQLEFGI